MRRSFEHRENCTRAAMEKPNVVQVSRPYFTNSEIAYLHSLTIAEDKKVVYNQRKHQIFQYVFQTIKILKFPLRVLNTTMIYYQRYYLFNKFEEVDPEDFTDIEKNMEHDPYLIAISCLFLASKNEDCIKKLRDLQVVSNKLRDVKEDNNYLDLQRKILMTVEFKLLQVLKFSFIDLCPSIDNLILQFAKKIAMNYTCTYFCWLIAFDLMSTPINLMIPPHCIALSVIIISLNFNPTDLLLKHKELVTDISTEDILATIRCRDFNCPESLVNESIIYILDFYIHQYNFSILTKYLPPINEGAGKEQIFKFMSLKSKFNNLQLVNEQSCSKSLLIKDDYLKLWDFSIAAKGTSRFMLSNKRRRFSKELPPPINRKSLQQE